MRFLYIPENLLDLRYCEGERDSFPGEFQVSLVYLFLFSFVFISAFAELGRGNSQDFRA